MGWSCNAAAALTLDGISALMESYEGSSNTFKLPKGSAAFFETSRREHADGAITGTVWEFLGRPGESQVRKAGAFRIEPDGKVTRFPLMPRQTLRDAEQWGIARWGEQFPGEPHPCFAHKHADNANRCLIDGRCCYA